MKMIDLFSGIGGFSLAAHQAGIETIAFCEINQYCQQVLQQHWPQTPIINDVRKLTKANVIEKGVMDDGEHIDIVCGGFPCQPFSVAGKRRGSDDDRHLWPEMRRVIDEFRPTWVVGENVTGLIGMALDNVLTDLEDIGYQTQSFVVPSVSVDAPQLRERVFIVAYSESERWAARWTESKRQQGQLRTTRSGLSRTQYDRQEGAVKSGMGGMSDGVSGRLDEHLWPALRGCEQFDWEPPRLITGITNRADRIECLGNAVVPQQVYPILKAIADIEMNIVSEYRSTQSIKL